ncbi:hypothetical protein CO180_00695 [candidate division WWE3 bacterium CG_4_9_14_3_um_filter_41_6]|uniref:POTRA domain-containing protein n=1 Tax=candidate division WWE3 bacterium CG_4_10_14_0_2_um_filter_41_14 TaxID=1975072 RepID=A0A2M7THL1_UNCKA|nr:MAG: hypothetical protein COY32_04755 [candidate division WWE3 bacterium CG_4_10_14_0_2_um_filter_41_14]PJA39468.1 MAG: hypothetical protein CO180_00695 [candidate division WWE3 bacterium CG_4_9_14_3_um_filter_41_6]
MQKNVLSTKLKKFFRKRNKKKSTIDLRTPLKLILRRKSFWIVTLCVFIAVFVIVSITNSDYFMVKTIEIVPSSEQYVARSEISFLVKSFLPSSIVALNSSEISERINMQYPSIRSVIVERHVPSTIVVKYEEYQPVISIRKGESWLLIADDGKAFYQYDNAVTIPETVAFIKVSEFESLGVSAVGDKMLDENVQWLVNVATLNWQDLGLVLSEVVLESQDTKTQVGATRILQTIYLASENRLSITIDSNQDLHSYASKIEAILRTALRTGKTVTSIDLRFDRPVVRYL